MLSTTLSYAETFSILLRRTNAGLLDKPTFSAAVSLLQNEVVNNTEFVLLSIHDRVIFASTGLMAKYNLNSTDAILLLTLSEYATASELSPCIVVSSDKRLLRAAIAEGYATINPKVMLPTDVAGFLTSL